jgi:FKBP-type peptidyl-prolyl cis-trans isomerase FkpA
VEYTGWFFDASQTDSKGVQFDSSTGTEPFVFTLGAGQVISGWDEGLVGMRVGGLRRLIIPPSLAYGETRRGPIPPNATLLFEVDLTAVQ